MPNTLVVRTMDDIAGVTDRHSLMAFLNSLNYQTEEIILDKEIDLGLPERATAIIKSIALISDYKTDGAQFRIYAIEAEPSHLRRTDIRTVLEPFYTRFPHINTLFVFTPERTIIHLFLLVLNKFFLWKAGERQS